MGADSMDTITRLEDKNSQLEKRNAALTVMMETNNRMLQELALQNSELAATMAAFTATMQEAKTTTETTKEEKTAETAESSPMDAVEHAQTPEKKRVSRKYSRESVIERTPPKPPEGTPQRKKKNKVSKSPASNPDFNPNSNRFSPLVGETFDDDDSFADAKESNELAPVQVTGEPVAQDDIQATATTPPTQQISPGFGSNGAGQVE